MEDKFLCKRTLKFILSNLIYIHFQSAKSGDITPPGVSVISHYKPFVNLPFPVP